MALQKKVLIINGVERMFIADPESSLAEAIRRLGLTGTKIGCGQGQCGSCTVILDGKVRRSCTTKLKNVKDYSTVLTIEGVGTENSLHPLQLAWIVDGAVQCGFCTPGFIVSAKGLLDENPSPTRDEVRDWFNKNRNACRCTGYKQIVDAVMDAAKVLRGELTMADLAWKEPENGRIYNSYAPRPTALAKVTGTCDYGADIALKTEGIIHLAVVQPNSSHANILSIDYSEAEKAAGVIKVITSKDIKGNNRITFPLGHPRGVGDGFERPILNDKKVFRRGDVIALIAADTEKHAREAAKLVKLELEPLPEYMNGIDAVADDALQVHPGIPNVFIKQPLFKGEDTRKVIDESKYAVEGSFASSREPHLPIEPDVGQAYIDENGILTLHIKTHAVSMPGFMISAGLGFPFDKIRVIENPAGGSFGYSVSPGTASLIAAATIALDGRPVSLNLSYEEHQHFTGKRAASFSNGKLSCDENGKLTAGEVHINYDKGSFSELAPGLIEAGVRFFGAPYYIPNVMGLGQASFSNQAFSTAYRGYGSPQTMTASEALMDMLADKAGMDPFDFRYINLQREGDTANAGHKMPVYPMPAIYDMLRPKYEELKLDAEKNSTPTKKRGVGVSSGTYIVGMTGDHSEVALELMEDGSITVYNTWEDIGQGGDIGSLSHAHEALLPLGIKADQIHLVMNDTALCPPTGIAAGSRSHFMAGNATMDAGRQLLNAMRKEDGSYRTYAEMAQEGIPTKYTGVFDAKGLSPLDPNTGQGNPTIDYSYCGFVAEVEVDMETGKAKVLEYHGVADCGVIGNYLAVYGQAYGGMEHMVGFALSEDYSDPVKHRSLAGAGIPYISDMPDADKFTMRFIETPRELGPSGSGGASEAFQSGGHMSIVNAVARAIGERVYTLPVTAEKIKAAIAKKASGDDSLPEMWYLGGDFYDEMDDIKANPIIPGGPDQRVH